MNTVSVQKPGWQSRLAISLIILILDFVGVWLYRMFEGPVLGSLATSQVEDSNLTYALIRSLISGDTIVSAIIWGSTAIIAAIWINYLIKSSRYHKALRENQMSANAGFSTVGMMVFLFLVSLSFLLNGCGPYKTEKIEEIQANETAFLVPMEGDTKTDQQKFMSEDFLAKSKVALTRVIIPQRKRDTGRAPWAYEWIPTMMLIKVNRSPITREWTNDEGTGTSVKKEAIRVESKDSIGFAVGVNLTAMIEEADAAKFLYKYAGKSLAEVVDTNVRGYLQTFLAQEFGSRDLTACKSDKGDIFKKAFEDAKKFFADYGITITNLGNAEGLEYENPQVQQSIDDAYVAEMDVKKADQERLAQRIRNQQNVEKAIADRKAAQEFAAAQNAQVAKLELDIRRMQAEATLEAAKKWNGQMPANIMPQGSSMLFGLDARRQ